MAGRKTTTTTAAEAAAAAAGKGEVGAAKATGSDRAGNKRREILIW